MKNFMIKSAKQNIQIANKSAAANINIANEQEQYYMITQLPIKTKVLKRE